MAVPVVLGVGLVTVALGWLFWPEGAPRLAAHPEEVQRIRPVPTSSTAPPQEVDTGLITPAPEPLEQAAGLKLEAVEVASEVAAAFPEDAISYALLGSAYFNIGQSEEAAEKLQRCIRLDPRQAEAYEILARVAYEKGELEEAVRLCEEGLRLAAANPEILNRLGRALLDLGRAEEATGVLQKALKLRGRTSESYYLLGQAYLQEGDYAEAKASFQGAIALLPDHTQAFFGLFTACTRLGETAEAARHRERFLELEAVDRRSLTDRSARADTLTGLPLVRRTVARTLFGAGQIYRFHKQPEKAAKLFHRVAMLDPDNGAARVAMESLHVQQDTLSEGVEALKQLANAQPSNRLNYLFLGRLHSRLEQFEAAEQAYRRVQALAPAEPEGYRALAELYLRSGRQLVEARVLAQQAVELAPGGANYYLLAFACAKNNDRDAALAAMERAVALSPDNQRYQEFLEQLRAAR